MNKLSLKVLDDRRVQTDITTYDGVSVMELHDHGNNEETVLIKLSRNKYYSEFKGGWELELPQDSVKFSGDEFTVVTSKAISYINDRDNPFAYMVSPY